MNASFVRSIEEGWARISQTPFARLVRHCVDRIFYGGESSNTGEVDIGIGAVLTLLAMPGGFISLFLAEKYGSLFHFLRGEIDLNPLTDSLPDEYLFIVLAMFVTSAVAIWKWDSLLPDRRDYTNLAPLPLPNRNILLANLAALLLLAIVLSVDVNAASSVLFPLLVCGSEGTSGSLAIFFGTHLASVVVASMFGFLAPLAVLGVLMTILPYRFFRRVSVYVRCVMLIFLMSLLVTSFAAIPLIARLQHNAHSWIRLLPPMWFLGLCLSMRVAHPSVLASLRGVVVLAFISVLVVAFFAYALSYRRCFTRSAETMEIPPAEGGRLVSPPFKWLEKLILRGPYERACYRFTLWTLFRSETHTLILGVSFSLAIVVISQTLSATIGKSLPANPIPSSQLLSIPLMFGYFLILGLRLAFEIPAPLRANWIFRLEISPETYRCDRLARKVMLTFVVPLIICTTVLVYTYFWNWRLGVLHATVVTALCFLLMEALIVRFRKIPFTCAAPTFKSHTIVAVVLSMIGFFAFTTLASSMEHMALGDPVVAALFIPVPFGIWLAIDQWRRNTVEIDRRPLFEEKSVTVQLLNLS